MSDLLSCPFCGGEAVQTRPADVHCKNSLCAGYKTRHMRPEEWNTRADLNAAALAERDALRARVERLEEALTPSGDTKAEYISEFYHTIELSHPGLGTEHRRISVPWTTIKEIMAAIHARAAADPARVAQIAKGEGDE